MPEKRVVGNQSQQFIEERMAGLEQFMLLLLSNPYLRLDATLRMFLTTKGSAEFEQAKKAHVGGVGADPAANPGLSRWFGVLRRLSLPADADAAIQELTASTDDLEARVVATLGAVTRFWESSKASAEALKAMRDSLGDWATSSAANAGSMSDSLRALKDHTGILSGKVKKAGDAFGNAHDLAVFSPNEIQVRVVWPPLPTPCPCSPHQSPTHASSSSSLMASSRRHTASAPCALSWRCGSLHKGSTAAVGSHKTSCTSKRSSGGIRGVQIRRTNWSLRSQRRSGS